MDVNEDGHLDILSGSYSRKGLRPMAGLFQVLYGREDGSFAKATPLSHPDGEPLVYMKPGEERGLYCTRPFAADWDQDGHLDLIVGEMRGQFVFIRGLGKGRFETASEVMRVGNEKTADLLEVPSGHGDPFVIDFDGDGDLDLVSGASAGGVYWAENTASAGKKPQLRPFKQLIQRAAGQRLIWGDDGQLRPVVTSAEGLERPGRATRVWVADYDGDGKLDLLVGDRVTLGVAAKGKSATDASGSKAPVQRSTGTVWLIRQK